VRIRAACTLLQHHQNIRNHPRNTVMERSLLNRSGSQRLFVMPDSLESKRSSQVTSHLKSVSLKRSTPVEDKENVNPDTFELAQNESRHRRQRLPQIQSFNDGFDTHKPNEEVSTPQDCKSRPPLRDITPIFQKVSAKEHISYSHSFVRSRNVPVLPLTCKRSKILLWVCQTVSISD